MDAESGTNPAPRVAVVSTAPGRPSTGPGHYLRDLVYGAMDGIVTSFAVVAGVSGASLSARVALVLGLANLAADGFSMGASNYLGLKSELHQTGVSVAFEKPWRHGFATFGAFVVAGAVPLAAIPWSSDGGVVMWVPAALLSLAALAVVGAVRGRMTGQSVWLVAAETVIVGALAGLAAFLVGRGGRALWGSL